MFDPNPGWVLDQIRSGALIDLGQLHPTDEARAYRDLETWAGERARVCEDRNEVHGVPERQEDQNG